MRGQKKGFKHTEETRMRISRTMSGVHPPGFRQRALCSRCGEEFAVPNLPRHDRACAERAQYQRLFREPLTLGQLKQVRISLRSYGISLAEYAALFDQQDGGCAICKGQPDRWRMLGVDHCHRTGIVRGLLCNKCNSILGLAKDDLGILLAVISYISGGEIRNATAQAAAVRKVLE